jgi:hypothetical protein
MLHREIIVFVSVTVIELFNTRTEWGGGGEGKERGILLGLQRGIDCKWKKLLASSYRVIILFDNYIFLDKIPTL